MGGKLMDLKAFQKAVEAFPAGALLGIGGQSIHMNPMGLIRELLRAGTGKYRLLASPVGGLGVDLLIGAGRALSLEFAQVSLWEYGMAPNFRRAVEEGSLELFEHT